MSTKQDNKAATANNNQPKTKAKELHTEGPLSEKDEVKQAEQNTQKQQNKSR